jgi:Tfp pilus assembly protein PilF
MRNLIALSAIAILCGCASKPSTPTAYDFVTAEAERAANTQRAEPKPSSDKDRAQSRIEVSVAQFGIGNFFRAESSAEEAVKLDPTNPNGLLILALSQEKLDKPSAVVRSTYLQLINNHQNFYDGFHNFGVYLCTHGHPEEGVSHLEKALTLTTHPEKTLLASSQCAPSADKRIELSKKTIDLIPTWPSAWYSLSHGYAEKKDWLRAHQALLRYFYLENQPSIESYRLALTIATAQNDNFHIQLYSQKINETSAVKKYISD